MCKKQHAGTSSHFKKINPSICWPGPQPWVRCTCSRDRRVIASSYPKALVSNILIRIETRLDGARWQEASLAMPYSNLVPFGSKFTVLKKVLMPLWGIFGSQQWFGTPIVIRRPGYYAHLPPRCAPEFWYKIKVTTALIDNFSCMIPNLFFHHINHNFPSHPVFKTIYFVKTIQFRGWESAR